MSEWAAAQLRLYDGNDNLVADHALILEAAGGTAWHEIGGEQYVVIPWTSNGDFGLYANDRRVYVTVVNTLANTTHVICDFVIENCAVEERKAANGDAQVKALRVSGRDRIKTLSEIPAKMRHISKFRQAIWAATAITETTLQMHAADIAAHPTGSLIGWTLELRDGNWSEIVGHTAGGLLTIDPPWQVNADDETADPPPAQSWRVYGAALTETTGDYTDLKLAMREVIGTRGGWGLDAQGYQSTQNGSFVATNDYSILRALQSIAAQTGEHFVRTPGTKKIRWRRDIPPATHPQYGNMILLSVPFDHTPTSIWYAHILPGQRLYRDTTERVTRVRPSGGGSGDEMLTLRDLPDGFTAAAGFTISGEYLISNAAEAGLLEISKDLRFTSIAGASDNPDSRELAAQALYRAALYWLREHDSARYILDCEVQTSIPIPAVTQVAVNLGGLTTEGNPIYIGMFVLESTPQMKTDGSVTYRLKLSDKKAPVLTDERLIAEAIRDTDTQIFTYSAPQRNSRKLDKKPAAEVGDSHPAATSGNAAIGVTLGQVVSLNLAGPSGLNISGSGLALADSVAGAGLAISNKILSVGLPTNSGLVTTADTVGMGTPGTLSATSTNAVSGSGHTHAVTSTTNAKTTVGTILQGDASGDVAVRNLTADKVITSEVETSSGGLMLDPASGVIFADGNLSFVGARVINTDSGSLTLAPAAALIVDPSNDVMQINPDVTVKTAHWASGFLGTGWGITYDGVLDTRKIQADELHVSAFIADVSRVKVGADWISQGRATMSRNFVVPSVGTTQLIFIEDIPGFEGMGNFADGDWVLLRVVDRPSGGLFTYNVWGQVTGYVDMPDGEQRWTFTTRFAPVSAVGNEAKRGLELLNFGKSGDGWIHLTSIDPTGSPHIGISTWQGSNPYTYGNITHWTRLGQLRGVTGVHEWGLWAGGGLSSRVRFSNLYNEIHGSRLSLYAGDGARLQVSAVQVLHWRTAGLNSTLSPNQDHTSQNVYTSGGNYYSTIDEGTGSPNHNDFVANANNGPGFLFVGLSNPTWGSTTYQAQIRVTTRGTGFGSDTARLYGQIFAADEATPLTAETLLRTQTNNSINTVTVTLPQHVATASQADWNNARLRLRWEYDINEAKEAIRLDPNAPSIAVGNPLPTDYLSGGSGFWTGRLPSGSYGLRVGHPSGPHMRWTGTNLILADGDGTTSINFGASGNGNITGVLDFGANGGIWQGTGSFASPTTGLKIWRDGGVGRLATYNGGTMQVGFDTAGKLVAGGGAISLDSAGMRMEHGAIMSFYGLNQQQGFINFNVSGGDPSASFTLAAGGKSGGLDLYRSVSSGRITSTLRAGTLSSGNYVAFTLDSGLDYASLSGGDLLISNAGLAIGYGWTIPIGRGVIASDLAGEHDNPHLVLQDSGDVAHGMTNVASTSTYANLRKARNGEGGLQINGLSELGTLALDLNGYTVGASSSTAASSLAAITLSAAKRSGGGPNVTSYAADENVLAVRNNGSSVFIVKGNGNFHYDGSGSAFDDHDDVGLLRVLSRELWRGTIDSVWDRFVSVNRQHLIDAGIMSDGGMVNGAALNRLLVGAVWQLNERISELEARLA